MKLSLLFSILLVSSQVMSSPGRRVYCTCYGETSSLWPNGSAYHWVSGCASGRGSSPACLDRRAKEIAAEKQSCKVLISASCPNQPKCLEALEKEQEKLSEDGVFFDINGRSTVLVDRSATSEVYVGDYDKSGAKVELTFAFPLKAGVCGTPTITSR